MQKVLADLFHYVSSVINDVLLWVFQVAIGVGTKLALESRRRSLTKKYVITSFVIASFVGYITDRFCTYQGYEQARGVAVAVMALLSESVVKYFDQNAGSILDAILRKKLGNVDTVVPPNEAAPTENQEEGA